MTKRRTLLSAGLVLITIFTAAGSAIAGDQRTTKPPRELTTKPPRPQPQLDERFIKKGSKQQPLTVDECLQLGGTVKRAPPENCTSGQGCYVISVDEQGNKKTNSACID